MSILPYTHYFVYFGADGHNLYVTMVKCFKIIGEEAVIIILYKTGDRWTCNLALYYLEPVTSSFIFGILELIVSLQLN